MADVDVDSTKTFVVTYSFCPGDHASHAIDTVEKVLQAPGASLRMKSHFLHTSCRFGHHSCVLPMVC